MCVVTDDHSTFIIIWLVLSHTIASCDWSICDTLNIYLISLIKFYKCCLSSCCNSFSFFSSTASFFNHVKRQIFIYWWVNLKVINHIQEIHFHLGEKLTVHYTTMCLGSPWAADWLQLLSKKINTVCYLKYWKVQLMGYFTPNDLDTKELKKNLILNY